jgi:hypothetical protein
MFSTFPPWASSMFDVPDSPECHRTYHHVDRTRFTTLQFFRHERDGFPIQQPTRRTFPIPAASPPNHIQIGDRQPWISFQPR